MKMTRATKEFWIGFIIVAVVMAWLIVAGQERDRNCAQHPNSDECVERAISPDYDM